MSRSYKKTPWAGDKKGKWKKRIANHKVRSWLKDNPEAEIQDGDFKKITESWDICDFGGTQTWEEYWESCWRVYYNRKRLEKKYRVTHKEKIPDEKTEYRKWLKWYKNK